MVEGGVTAEGWETTDCRHAKWFVSIHKVPIKSKVCQRNVCPLLTKPMLSICLPTPLEMQLMIVAIYERKELL